jgi:hypothetical protein
MWKIKEYQYQQYQYRLTGEQVLAHELSVAPYFFFYCFRFFRLYDAIITVKEALAVAMYVSYSFFSVLLTPEARLLSCFGQQA